MNYFGNVCQNEEEEEKPPETILEELWKILPSKFLMDFLEEFLEESVSKGIPGDIFGVTGPDAFNRDVTTF